MPSSGFFALTIAGSDCSGGAGIQADLKTFAHFGVYGASAVTCVVAEHARHVGSVVNISPQVVGEQISLCCQAHSFRAAKTGMLPTPQIISSVCAQLKTSRFSIVVDPVMVASTGTPLVTAKAISLLRRDLLSLATLITPNLHEAQILLNGKPITRANFIDRAKELADMYECAVLLKGGHLPGNICRDVLVSGSSTQLFESKRVLGVNTHGTGCTLSAAITASIARGKTLVEACADAKDYIDSCLKNAARSRKLRLLNHQFSR